ncbi:MAG: Fe-S cluster assembly protein SufD [Candidatus Marinimicrobia bacterium]|nr:Fe-S cluster assembly protein SufD [Candidatus Neomarinimicrobiota bacterium]
MTHRAPDTKHFYQNLWMPTSGDQMTFLKNFREESLKKLEKTPFPTLKHEEWKYTDLTDLSTQAPIQSTLSDLDGLTPEAVYPYTFNQMKSHVLVFVNGYYAPRFSTTHDLPIDMCVESFAEATQKDPDGIKAYLGKTDKKGNDYFSYLNGAFFTDGAVIRIPENYQCERPIHLLYLTVGNENLRYSAIRNIILMGAGSSATVVETYDSLDRKPVLTNAVTEVFVGENAGLRHHILQLQNEKSLFFGSTNSTLLRDSRYLNTWVSLGSRLSRKDVDADLTGPGSNCQLYGLYAGRDGQLMDNRTVITHHTPHATSNQVYKGILDDESRGVFNGKILVAQDAQKTEAHQLNRNLILSDKAHADSKPQLKIFADDVKCSHGATVGQLDKTAMFYLQSRGIAKEVARSMLTFAFANDVVDSIILGSVRFFLYKRLYNRFGRDWGSAEDFESLHTMKE